MIIKIIITFYVLMIRLYHLKKRSISYFLSMIIKILFRYKILELLGKGTFGQVIRCSRSDNSSQYALKIIKNKPAYTNQALTEIRIFQKIKDDMELGSDRIVEMADYFVFRNHICLVMELLHVSIYDLLKAVNFNGFALNFIRGLAEQILKGLIALRKSKIIHCDLKPENILFET